jgi:hypothetical protein
LLALKRYVPARQLLRDCRLVLEQQGGPSDIAHFFSALAALEHGTGNFEQAVVHEQTALRFRYVSGIPAECAASHFNLANYLGSSGESTAIMLAHRLAHIVIEFQTADGRFPYSMNALMRDLISIPAPAPLPTNFRKLCDLVEQIEGVCFQELFDRLPRREPDGDAALRLVLDLTKRIDENLAPLPPSLRFEFFAGNQEAFEAALAALPPEERRRVQQEFGSPRREKGDG